MLTFVEFLMEQQMSHTDARSLLGLRDGFSDEELRSAYHRAALRHHPDGPGGSAEMMKVVNAAHQKLKTSYSEATPKSSSSDENKEYWNSHQEREDHVWREQRAAKRKTAQSDSKIKR